MKIITFLVSEGHSFDEVGKMTLGQVELLCKQYSHESKTEPKEELQSFSDAFKAMQEGGF